MLYSCKAFDQDLKMQGATDEAALGVWLSTMV